MSSTSPSLACQTKIKDGDTIADFTVAILGAAGTGKTALLEVLCLHQFEPDDDDGSTVNEVRFGARATSSMKFQQKTQSLGADQSSLDQLCGRRATESQRQQQVVVDDPAGCKSNTKIPTSKRVKLNDTSTARMYNKGTHCELPQPSSVRPLQSHINDLKDSGVTRRIFQVEVDEPLVEMQEGSQVTFLDIPGLNAKEFPVHNKFVSDKWDDIDCAIIVMGGTRDDADCKEHEEVLLFVEEMCRTRKSVPVLVVLNKMDSYEPCDHQELHKGKMNLLIKIFGGVTSMIDQSAIPRDHNSWYPIFLPTSVRDAGFYRFGSISDKDDFQNWADKTSVNKLGLQVRDKRVWDVLSDKEKILSVFELIQDPIMTNNLIAATNFSKLGVILQHFAGMGTSTSFQVRDVLAQKLKGELASLVSLERHTTHAKMNSLIQEYDLIKLGRRDLVRKYRALVEGYRQRKMESFRCAMNTEGMHDIMEELALYLVFCDKFELEDEIHWAEKTMETILRQQIQRIFEESNTWNVLTWKTSMGTAERNLLDWKALSPFDWQRIFSSVLLLRCESTFSKSFANEILILEQKQRTFQAHSTCCSKLTCSSTPCNDPGHKSLMLSWSLLSHSKEGYKDCFDNDRLANPLVQTFRDLDDPAHWGHVAWLFCKFKKDATRL